MHEFSIASAVVELAAKHVPAGAVLRGLVIEAGPLQGVDPEAMRWAWQAVTAGGPWAGSTIEVKALPWRMRCPDCGVEFERDEMTSRCACGGELCHPVGGNELLLRTLTVDAEQEMSDAGAGDRECAEDER